MTEKNSALHSHYIIDGIRFDMTPAELLEECTDGCGHDFPDSSSFNDIIDESTEPPLSSFSYDPQKEHEYIEKTTAATTCDRTFGILHPEHFTRLQIAKTLLSRLWNKGHFKLGNLKLWAQWEWDTAPVGNMSAFYRSVESAGGYIYGLGVRLEDYLFIESDGCRNVKFFAWLEEQFDRSFTDVQDDKMGVQDDKVDGLFKSSPYESSHPWISEERACPATLVPDTESWIIFIPFDTCTFKLGGSLLTQVNGCNGGIPPEIADPDYFIDCYEVVRELTEDGIIMSGVTVADGGLIAAAERMCGNTGMDIDIKGIMQSYQESSRQKILFGEVPGILLQISDENYDYVDSQLLLQDVAYYPIGHPDTSHKGVSIAENGKTGIADILASLIVQASEGED